MCLSYSIDLYYQRLPTVVFTEIEINTKLERLTVKSSLTIYHAICNQYSAAFFPSKCYRDIKIPDLSLVTCQMIVVTFTPRLTTFSRFDEANTITELRIAFPPSHGRYLEDALVDILLRYELKTTRIN